MASTISTPFLPSFPRAPRKHINNKRHPTSTLAVARRDHHSYNNNGRQVDENMIVLRKRIHEMKIIERNYEPPAEWMDWEKNYYVNYDSIICDAMGMLQSQLMNTRPSLALGMLGLIAFSVPVSTSIVLFHLLDLSKIVLATGGH
ncbi:hypothetical protein LIER_20141 [Lithospermum erythrorhizon]|uniref:Mediator of RNA polymerase II transcription subunit n=1 Tax=Lithospermum erythrorhizon TaxID=34254 RepID=A0AAV3PDG7_LITER